MSNQEKLEKIRHSLAHLLAASVKELYPDAKPTIGPAIDNGFYYDFDDLEVGEDDLSKIEKMMKKLLPKWKDFEGEEKTVKEAKEYFKDNPYKLELIDELEKEGQKITFYTSGDFIDLCRGGHVDNPSQDIDPKSFKLSHIAGAYWRGDENNKMLTRIYGLAFSSEKELKDCLQKMEEAKERDHRKIGKEMDLFSFSELVGSGLPLWSPRGTVLRNMLQDRLFEISKKYGMLPVTIPHIAKKKLYEISGHAEKFGDELIEVKSHYDDFVMKPVNCPHHTQIFASKQRSYRDMPFRLMESTMQYRDEKPGEIGGLTRVRSITVDDGHIFCTPDQIKREAKNIAKIIEEFYTSLGMFGDHWVSLSVRDPNTPDAYIGDPKDWEKAESMLQDVSDELKLDAKRVEGEAAIYGPKLDYMFKDSLGREWQLGTIQIDFAMPKRFELEYIDKDGHKKTPVMIHRAILGSYERFLAIIIEHFAGAFPFWLSPVQVKILPIGEDHHQYATEIYEKLKSEDIRVEIDKGGDTLGKKIRDWKIEKIPYALVIGDEEVKLDKITVESRDGGKIGQLDLDEFIEKVGKDNLE